MKIYIYESDMPHGAYLQRMLSAMTDIACDVKINPNLNSVYFSLAEHDAVLFLIDTRTKVAGGNFLTLARKFRENSEACHICFMSQSAADIGFCYKKLVRPSGFLLKPVEKSDLQMLIRDIALYENNKKLHKDKFGENPQMVLNEKGEKHIVKISDILYFTAFDKKINCYTKGRVITFYGSLKTLETQYNKFFLRCHSGFLINRKRIIGFSKKKMTVTISDASENEIEISVSKSRCRDVEEYLKAELENR